MREYRTYGLLSGKDSNMADTGVVDLLLTIHCDSVLFG